MIPAVVKGKANNEIVYGASMPERGKIDYYIITNLSQATITVNISIATSEENSVHIAPLNMELEVGECFESVVPLTILRKEVIVVEVQGGIADYYFSLTLEDEVTRLRSKNTEATRDV